MIAPLRHSDTEVAESRRRLHHAHHLLASTLLTEPPSTSAPPPVARIAPWKAWLFAGWVAIAVAAYGTSMLGLW